MLFLKTAYGPNLNLSSRKDSKLARITELYLLSSHLQSHAVLRDSANMRLAEQEQVAVGCFMDELQLIAGRLGDSSQQQPKKKALPKADIVDSGDKENVPVTVKSIKKKNKTSVAGMVYEEKPMEEVKIEEAIEVPVENGADVEE